ncbi:pseudaminic acid synthase [Methylobacterium sp. J-026]|uniref:pseudaminic acid synthase n=1 Tax=Methylobacterium sp. J-026 TaxID=2836624 RepID=UPI001FB9BCBB|nr:pseudaminic acid synthase [Methylobacterium sp. J-026]MCJ2136346.1 pseudaminic acid synthase [Methylobacterium sp. J-026]
MTSPAITIDGRPIGLDHPPYVICELSANHNGSLERALALLDVAAATGADAIKIQTYTPDTLTIDHDGPDFRIRGGLWDGQTLYELYQTAFTPYEWHAALVERARQRGVTLFSTPFDETAVALLSGLGMPAYKIASFEAVDLPLIARVAAEGKPMIISTGMADRAEIGEAVEAARAGGAEDLVLLHCVSCYPARYEQANLRTIPDLAASYGVIAGLSDHTPGTACAVAAVALGACVIEKHFTLDRSAGGPDATFSLEPDEFTRLVSECRDAWLSLGGLGYARSEAERASQVFRRSLYVVRDMAPGAPFTAETLRSIRPGYGLSPKYLLAILGRRATRALARGHALSWEDVSGGSPDA